MKIELKLSTDSIIAVNELLCNVYEVENSIGKKANVHRSIGFDLADKFDRKCKELIKKQCIFNATKKHKITLKYYEAWSLEFIIRELIGHSKSPYSKQLSNLVADQLNQKLA